MEDIDKNIIAKQKVLNEKMTKSEKNYFHFNSINNFIYHITRNEISNSSKLYELKLLQNKKLILDYINLIENSGTDYNSKYLYKNYVEPVGEFLNRHHNFSFSGGVFGFFQLLKYLFTGLIIDSIIYMFIDRIVFIGTFVMIVYFFLKFYYKRNKKLIYGPNY